MMKRMLATIIPLALSATLLAACSATPVDAEASPPFGSAVASALSDAPSIISGLTALSDACPGEGCEGEDVEATSGASAERPVSEESRSASGSSDESGHEHVWRDIVESSWVVDTPAWVEWVLGQSYLQCSCGARYATVRDWAAHAESAMIESGGKDLGHSYSVRQDRQAVEHGEVGHYEDVVVGSECQSCGARR